jgi:hypothetical protein
LAYAHVARTIPTIIRPESQSTGGPDAALFDIAEGNFVFGAIASPTLIGWIKVTTGSLYDGLNSVALLLVVGMVVFILFVPFRSASNPVTGGKCPT